MYCTHGRLGPLCTSSSTNICCIRARYSFNTLFVPQWAYLDHFQKSNRIEKASQIKHYNVAHGVKALPDIPDNTPVWITTEGGPVEGTVVYQADKPRSYVVETPTGSREKTISYSSEAICH